MSFIAGHYTFTYDDEDIGQLKDGFKLTSTNHGENITGDNFGNGVQDQVYLGRDMTSDCNLMEWDVAIAAGVIWPWGGAEWVDSGVVGRLAVQDSIAQAVEGTAVTGPPAQSLGQPASFVLTYSILREESQQQHDFSPRHRVLPLSLRHFPVIETDGTSVSFGDVT